MDKTRRIKKVLIGQPTLEGAGVHLRRGFGFREVPMFDPFLMFDDFRQDDPDKYLPGFPWHPHRGIETITYMIRGSAEHGDSMGNSGVIGAGDVQWMTAGSGIVHQEMPKGGADGRMGGFQLWANLPASQKMMDPRYRDVKKADIPEVALPGGVTARVICGTAGGARGPVRDIVIDPEYIDVAMPPQDRVRPPDQARPHGRRLRLRGPRLLLGRAGPVRLRRRARQLFRPRADAVPGRPFDHSLRRREPGAGGHHRLARPVPPLLGPAARRARRLAGTHRHEHPGRAPDGLPRIPRRDLHQAPEDRLTSYCKAAAKPVF